MKTRINILTQVHENYGSLTSPHWKPKGSQMFTCFVDSDLWMYEQKFVERTLSETIRNKMSDSHTHFTIVNIEPLFTGLVDIQKEFNEQLNEPRGEEV
jgi:hypothetical protein